MSIDFRQEYLSRFFKYITYLPRAEASYKAYYELRSYRRQRRTHPVGGAHLRTIIPHM